MKNKVFELSKLQIINVNSLIEDHVFNNTRISQILLNNASVEGVQSQAFVNIEGLYSLDLSNNPIHSRWSFLTKLTNLRHLKLANVTVNSTNWIDELPVNIDKLKISNCGISFGEKRLIKKFDRLQELDMSFNEIVHLPERFSQTFQVRSKSIKIISVKRRLRGDLMPRQLVRVEAATGGG